MAYEIINLEFLKDLKRRGNRSVIDFCMKMKLIASGFKCPACELSMKLYEESAQDDGFVWSCPVQRGNRTHPILSVRSGSWFEGTKLPLIDILIIVYFWMAKTQCARISDELRIPRITIYKLIYRCQNVCLEIVLNESVVLGGPAVIVDIYEAEVLKYNSNRAQITSEWVFLVAERCRHKCFAHVNENREKTVLLNILHTRVLPGTTIICECWNAYCSFEEKINIGIRKNLLIMDVEPDRRENFWTLIENSIYGQKVGYVFDSYVAEFMWHHFHEGNYQTLFMSFLKSISSRICP